MDKSRTGIAIKAYGGTALTKRQDKSINIRQSLAARIQALTVVYIHAVKDPLLGLCQIHNGKSPRGVAGELKAHLRIGGDDHAQPMQCEILLCP